MIDRRRFLQVAGGGVAALAWRPGFLRASPPDRALEHGRPLREFAYRQVSFQPGLQQAQLEQTHAVLMHLNEDSLLRPFRARAGLPAPGCDLAGWYSSDDFGSETFGQWLSAL